MSISAYSRDKLQNHEFGGATYTAPTAWYVKLHLGDPGTACTANPAANTTRAQVTSWAGSSAGSDASAATATWTNVPNAETYSHISIWDNVSAGNALRYGALTAPVAVLVGATFTLPSGQLAMTLA